MTWILSTLEFNHYKTPLIMVCMEGVLVAPIESYPLTQVLWMHTATPPSHMAAYCHSPLTHGCILPFPPHTWLHTATPPSHMAAYCHSPLTHGCILPLPPHTWMHTATPPSHMAAYCHSPLTRGCILPLPPHTSIYILWMHTATPPSHKYILAWFPGSSPCTCQRKMHAATPPCTNTQVYTDTGFEKGGANMYYSLPEAVHRGTYRAENFFRLHFSVIRMGSRGTFVLCTASSRCTRIAGPGGAAMCFFLA